MRNALLSMLCLVGLFIPRAVLAQEGTLTLSIEDLVGRIKQTEATLIANLRSLKPVMEIYVQNLEPDKELGFVPVQDTYFLGRFAWDQDGPRLQTLSGNKETMKRRAAAMKVTGLEFLPDGFAATLVPDWQLFDLARYDFRIVRREFVGEVRAIVLDVKPKGEAVEGFSGRLWIEDANFNIIRFNGINRKVERSLFKKKIPVHVDAWRINVLPNVWIPSYIYCEETDLQGAPSRARTARFKSHIRMWGYDRERSASSDQFTSIEIAEPSIQDNAQSKQLSPVASQRRWEQEAETNVIERLEQAGLLAPYGDLEKILETVVNNLMVTNDIVVDAPVKTRVLLTSPLESFTVGHTIVLSRGLIDVLPDESSLAMMLAHELSHVVLGHPLIDTQFAFADRMMVDDDNLLAVLKVARDESQEAAADAKLIDMLGKSPYKDKLSDAGLFLRVVADLAKRLPNLIQPHIGDHLAGGGGGTRLASIMNLSPELAPDKLDQVAALPIGGRLLLDPWTSRLELSRAVTPTLKSVREKAPFAVTPLMPNLTYFGGRTAAVAAPAGKPPAPAAPAAPVRTPEPAAPQAPAPEAPAPSAPAAEPTAPEPSPTPPSASVAR
jgi:hypothetical protein